MPSNGHQNRLDKSLSYYDKYFEIIWDNIKNIWKRIKSLISLKTVTYNVPTVLSLDNGDTITNPYDMASIDTFPLWLKPQKKHKIFT